MISMDIRQQILHFNRVEELSLREISRKTGADRKTVTRLKCTDIHHELQKKGLSVSYSSVNEKGIESCLALFIEL